MKEAREALGATLSETLRYSLPGATFLMSIAAAFRIDLSKELAVAKEADALLAALLLVCIFTVASTVYALHRASPLFIIGWMVSLILGRISLPNDISVSGKGVNSAWAIVAEFALRAAAVFLFYLSVAIAVKRFSENGVIDCGGVAYLMGIPMWFPLFMAGMITWMWGRYERSDLYDGMLRQDIKRWINLKNDFIQRRIQEWGAQVHFMYCVAWSGLLAIDAGVFLALPRGKYYYQVYIASFALLIFAFLYHLRYLECEEKVFDEEEKFKAMESAKKGAK